MHAAARGETGSGGIGAGKLAEGEIEGSGFGKEVVLGKLAELDDDAGVAALSAGEETPCAFPSSFFHMRHLDVEN
jgi:hypothetical protein